MIEIQISLIDSIERYIVIFMGVNKKFPKN